MAQQAFVGGGVKLEMTNPSPEKAFEILAKHMRESANCRHFWRGKLVNSVKDALQVEGIDSDRALYLDKAAGHIADRFLQAMFQAMEPEQTKTLAWIDETVGSGMPTPTVRDMKRMQEDIVHQIAKSTDAKRSMELAECYIRLSRSIVADEKAMWEAAWKVPYSWPKDRMNWLSPEEQKKQEEKLVALLKEQQRDFYWTVMPPVGPAESNKCCEEKCEIKGEHEHLSWGGIKVPNELMRFTYPACRLLEEKEEPPARTEGDDMMDFFKKRNS